MSAILPLLRGKRAKFDMNKLNIVYVFGLIMLSQVCLESSSFAEKPRSKSPQSKVSHVLPPHEKKKPPKALLQRREHTPAEKAFLDGPKHLDKTLSQRIKLERVGTLNPMEQKAVDKTNAQMNKEHGLTGRITPESRGE